MAAQTQSQQGLSKQIDSLKRDDIIPMTGHPAALHECLLFPSHTLSFFLFANTVCASYVLCSLTDVVITPPRVVSAAASSFSFCRPAVEYRALPEDFKQQLSRRTGGNLTWHDGRGQKSAGGRAIKLLQQPGTEALQVNLKNSVQTR